MSKLKACEVCREIITAAAERALVKPSGPSGSAMCEQRRDCPTHGWVRVSVNVTRSVE